MSPVEEDDTEDVGHSQMQRFRESQAVDTMRQLRAQFLDTAIGIEADVRSMIVDYYLPGSPVWLRELFEDQFIPPRRVGFGTLESLLAKVMRRELDTMHPDAREFATEALDLLHTAVEDRNRFAHLPMDRDYGPLRGLDEGDMDVMVVSSFPRIGDMTIEDANGALNSAERCHTLLVTARAELLRVIDRRPRPDY